MSAKKSDWKLPELYFDNRSGQYWMKLACGRYLNLDGRNCKLHMMHPDFIVNSENDWGLKNGDRVLRTTQLERWIDYAGPLAGHKSGMFTNAAGKRILVTSEAHPVQPKKGKCGRIQEYLEALLGVEQLTAALCWLKVAWETLNRGGFRPGQLLVLAGPPGSGKSFYHVLVTLMLGGRVAKPYRYMTGQTNFNSDLAGAEHLIIEDENAKSNTAARREFGTAIKDWTVNEEISVHAKGREAITLGFFRRLSLSVNWETEYLMILPPMDHSILDKVMLFKCAPAKLDPAREKNIEMLREELPGLVYELTQMKIPRSMRDDRFGVKAYHNAEILEVLSDISPETRLSDLIQTILFAKGTPATQEGEWEGTAIELEKQLSGSEFRYAVEKLLPYSSACGTFLARLASKNPERFSSSKNRGQTYWHIKKGDQ